MEEFGNYRSGNNVFHLFEAVRSDAKVLSFVEKILTKDFPIKILLEGSGYITNLDVIHQMIKYRNFTEDAILFIDIDPNKIKQYREYMDRNYFSSKYESILANINQLPFSDNSIDLIIHNFTVNFNSSERDDQLTLLEIKRVLKIKASCCLFSVGVLEDRQSNEKFIPSISGVANLTHSASYYQNTFNNIGLKFIRFNDSKTKSTFPFKRYLLYYV